MSEGCTIYCETAPFEPNDPRVEMFFLAVEATMPGTKVDHVILSSRYRWQPALDRVALFNEREFDNGQRSHKRLTTIFGNGRRDDDAVIVTLGSAHLTSVDDLRREKAGLPIAFEMRKVWACRVSLSNERESTCLLVPHLLAAVCSATGAVEGWADTGSGLGQQHRSTENVKRGIACVGPGGRQFYEEWVLGPGERAYDIASKLIAGELADGFRFPMQLRWINYWSNTVAKALGFPDAVLDKPIEGLYRRVGNQGWLVRLTEDPLDLDIPEHLERLNWAYSRFSLT